MLKYLNTLRIIYTKELRNHLNRKRGCSYAKFLIIGLPRTGTTLLHTYLNSHPNIISGGERKIELIKQEVLGTSTQEKIVFPPFSKHIEAVGAKILLPTHSENNFFFALNEILNAEPSLKILFLNRENILRWYVSLCIARHTAQWSQMNRQSLLSVAQRQVKIPVNNLLSTLKKASNDIEGYSKLLNQFNTLEISYEAFSTNPTLCLAEIQNFLGVNPSRLFSLLHKQNPEPLSELILNFKDVEKALCGSPFQKFLAG